MKSFVEKPLDLISRLLELNQENNLGNKEESQKCEIELETDTEERPEEILFNVVMPDKMITE